MYCKKEISQTLITAAQIKKKIKELGARITKDYKGKDLVVVCVLRGAIVFVTDLIRAIDLPLEVDFIWAQSYEGTKSAGEVKLIKKPESKLKGRDVLLIDDLLDTGLTFERTMDVLKKYNPKSLKVGAFLDKPARRLVKIKLDYVGFKIPNKFIVGYGMDFNQRYRNLPFIGVLK